MSDTSNDCCALCKTVGGCLRHNGKPERYRGEPFGVAGRICKNCRNREKRHAASRAKGIEPKKWVRPGTKKPGRKPNPSEDGLTFDELVELARKEYLKITPDEVTRNRQQLEAERHELNQKVATKAARRMRWRFSELSQPHWACMAARERQAAVESRRPGAER